VTGNAGYATVPVNCDDGRIDKLFHLFVRAGAQRVGLASSGVRIIRD